MKKRKRWKVYLFAYVFTALIAIVGLIVNIRTVALNDANQKLSKQVKILQEENQKLNLAGLQATRLEEVERVASDNLLMVPTRKINYLMLNE
jgi:hypothetical protein